MSSLSQRLMNWAVRIAPERRREWAQAMTVELDCVPGEWARLQWASGCLLSVLREVIAGGMRHATILHAEESTMRKVSFGVAAVSVALFLFLLISPMFRQALRVGEGAWMTNNGELAPSEAATIIRDARQQKDANLLAWVALRYETREGVALAREAVAMDERLTWIYYPVCQSRVAVRDPECYSMIKDFEKWAPDNAVPWMLEAAFARSRDIYPMKDAPPTDVKWVEAMDRAFASAHYNDYRAQRIELERSVYRTGRLNSPMLILQGLFQQIPEIADIQWEAKKLRQSDPRKVATFAGVMLRDSQTDIEQLVASSLLTNDSARAMELRLRNSREPQWESFIQSSAVVVQCSAIVLLFGVALLLAAILVKVTNAITGREWLKSGVAEIAGVAGAAIIGLSSIAIYGAYWPYEQVLQTFLDAPENRVNEVSMAAFWSLTHVSFMVGKRDDFMLALWTAVLVGCVVALLWLCSRMASRGVRAGQLHHR